MGRAATMSGALSALKHSSTALIAKQDIRQKFIKGVDGASTAGDLSRFRGYLSVFHSQNLISTIAFHKIFIHSFRLQIKLW